MNRHPSYDQAGTGHDYEPYGAYRDEPEHLHPIDPPHEPDTHHTAPEERSLDHDFAATTRPSQEKSV